MSTINLDDESAMQAECRRLVDREVKYCVSSLVWAIAQGYGNVVTKGDTSKPLAELAEQASMLSLPLDDYEEAAREAGWTECPDGRWWREPLDDDECERHGSMFLGSGPFIWADDAKEACDWDRVEPHQREVYEHWIVSDWLAAKLEEQGEQVDTDFAGLTVWARTCTGQAILLDSVICAIVRNIHATN